jgi:hypothetical protein
VFFLPENCDNTHRYSKDKQVDKNEIDFFLSERVINEQFVIIFIDRYAQGGYKFYPLRMGIIKSCNEEGGLLVFKVIYKNYKAPKDIDEFQVMIKEKLGTKNLPHLVNGDPKINDDGFYAINAPDIFQNINSVDGNDAWEINVKHLQETKVFKDSEDKKFSIFARIDIHSDNKKLIKDENKSFPFIKDNHYILKFYYKFPQQLVDTKLTTGLELVLGDGLKTSNESKSNDIINIDISNVSDSKDFEVFSKRKLEEFESSIYIKPTQPDKFVCADKGFNYSIIISRKFWIYLILLILGSTLLTTLQTFDKNNIDLVYNFRFFDAYWNNGIKLVPGAINMLLLYLLFRLVGSKFF